MNSVSLESMTRAEREAILQLAKAGRARAKSPTAGIPARTSARGQWPLSFAQQRLWFIAQGWPTAHSVPIGLSLRGPLDKVALQAALDRIVRRHESLRTLFEVVDGQPMQRIADPGAFTLAHHDLTGHEDPAEEVEHWRGVEASAPFDLAKGPLIRGRLLRLGEQDHVLLLTTHHIVFDGWSLGVLTTELGELYRAYGMQDVSPGVDPLPALPIQYPDYAVWQRHWLTGEVRERELGFWRTQLSTAPALVSLPTDKSRPAVQDQRLQNIPVELDQPLTASLKALSQRHGTTLYMTLLAAWGAVVARLAGQDEVVIGTPVANRLRTEVESLIGLFANMLALRLDLGDRPTVAQLLARVRAGVLQAHGHQDLPFEQVVEALKPQRTLAYSPIFQLVFAWQNTPEVELALAGLSLAALPPRGGRELAQYDLLLELHERRDRIVGTLSFATALFEPATMKRHLGYLQAMLRGMAGDDAQTVDAIAIVDQAERQQVLAGWNDTACDHPRGLCVHELFEQQAARTPDEVAVVYGGRRLKFAELNRRANQLAHYLSSRGVGPDTIVGLCVERSVEMVIGLLGILKAGGAYLPLDPAYPSQWLQHTLDDAAPGVVLTQKHLRSHLPATTAEVIALDDEGEAITRQSLENPNARALGVGSHHLAYVIYTSGSTGKPKGVMIEHASVLNLWQALERRVYSRHADCQRVGVNASFTFDGSVKQLVQLLSGRTLCIVPQALRMDPGALHRFMIEQRIDSIDCTPSQLRWLISAGLLGAGHPAPRLMLVGGEAIDPTLWRTLASSRRIAFYNVYGPTECTVDAAVADVNDPVGTPVIGRPIANVRIYILDRHRQPVPAGVVGELYIGGAGVAHGYLNQPQLTAARFMQDPFSIDPRARMYRSGDLGRYLPDGQIEFAGRNDEQVKIRGLRIELGEIEAQLLRLAGVREAVVLAREDKGLVAYLTGDGMPDVQTLRTRLSEKLPHYMVPAAYVVLDRMPLTPHGKFDRKALPAPEDTALGQKSYEAPRGKMEMAVAQMWCELLRVERVGRNDDFFDLGGHSLLAVQMNSRLRQRLELEVPVSSLFDHPVLCDFAALVDEASSNSLPALVPMDRPEHLPLSFAQQRLWFISQMGSGESTAYHVPGAVRLRGRLDETALQVALDRIVQRHEALRTRFDVVDGQPVQRVVPKGAVTLLRHDLADIHGDVSAAVEHWCRLEASTPFDLVRGPLIRGRLLHLDEQDHVLLLTMHHIVFDGWSLGVLTGELSELYRAYAIQGLSPEIDPLPALPVQYPDYAVWQRNWLTGEVQERELAFWREHLATAPALVSLPTDNPRPPVLDYRGQSVPVELDQQLTASLKDLSQRHGTTLYMTLLAAWGALVARLAGQDEVVIGTPVANRKQAEMEPLIGFFVNTLALHLDLSGRPSVARLLAQVRECVLQAQNHQDLPFEQVVERLKPQRTLAHSPIFQVMFAWQTAPRTQFELDGLILEEMTIQPASAKFDLTLDLQEQQERIVGTLSFATALFEPATARRYAGYLEAMLRAMVCDDSQAVDAIAIVGDAERRQVLRSWNDTARAYPRDSYVHQVFEQQAERTPDAVAVMWEGQQLTYAELNRRANRLAHWLLAQGVRPEDRVALCLERSPEMIVGMLGTLKAGGVYVPLDPSHPPGRLARLLQDASPVVSLTQERFPTAGSTADDNLEPAQLGLKPHQAAYVLYTSGSSGEPKGVIVTHPAINRLSINNGYTEIGSSDCVAHCSNPAFDASTFEVWAALLNGARVLIVAKETCLEPARLAAQLQLHAVSALFATPALFNQYAQTAPGMFRGLKYLLVGGDRCDAEVVRRVLRAGGPENLLNGYGPTETTTFATTYRVEEAVTDGASSVPIGRPISNTTVYILDATREPVPIGVTGELYIGGAGVARGYLNQPELTAERFLPDPFSADPRSRMYRTGDFARWRADGNIEFLGRNDTQVKIRGFRIEPGEIEAQLLLNGQVKEAVVLARDSASGEKRLVAYLTPKGAAPQIEALREHLLMSLPEYMVPTAFVMLDNLPLTSNGKVNRNALPAPDPDSVPRREYEAPRGEVEIALARIWSELLHVERVGRNDNFFDLGGHSLLITRMIDGARRRGLLMDLRQVFDASTLERLAANVKPDNDSMAQGTLVPVRASGSQRPLFCLHEGFGTVLAYERLARFIDADIPVYSVEARALHEDPPIYRTVVDMARDYLPRIVAVQPAGPYRLAGWSGGGLIAYEIAHQLLAQGESVEFLGMIDTYNLTRGTLEGEIAEAKHYVIRILQYTHPELPAEVLRALLAFDDLETMVGECHRQGWLKTEVTGREVSRLFQVANDIARACVEYCTGGALPTLALSVDLFSAQEPARVDRTNGWSRVLGPRLKITPVGGSHMSMMQDDALITQIAGPMNRALLGAVPAAARVAHGR